MNNYEEPTIQLISDQLEDVITTSVELPEMPIAFQIQLDVRVDEKENYLYCFNIWSITCWGLDYFKTFFSIGEQ